MKLTIKTYAELHKIIAAWACKRRMPLLAVTSRPGLGKTEAARRTAAELSGDSPDAINLAPPLTLDTHVTPMQLYMDLYHHRDAPVILDDLTDRVLSNAIALSILKSLCDSREERRVEYNSSTTALDDAGIPRSFTTRSPVLLLSNVFTVASPAQLALESRSVHASFEPPTAEVLAYIASWARDGELVDWFRRHLAQFPWLSARDYAVCEQLKESGLDWQDYAMRSSDPVLAEVMKLAAMDGMTDSERVRLFSGSRATYYRKLAVLRGEPQAAASSVRTRQKLGRASKIEGGRNPKTQPE